MTISNGKRLKNKSLRYSEYYDMMNEFDSLYEQSKAGKTFTDLMQIITSFDNIKLAYRNIKRNLGSITPGSDGWNIKHLENMNVEDFIRKVQNKMTWYKPKEVRRVEIPKPNGGIRPLGIPSIWDRIIQQCILYKWYNKNVQKIQNKNVQLLYCYLGGKQYDFKKQHYHKFRN